MPDLQSREARKRGGLLGDSSSAPAARSVGVVLAAILCGAAAGGWAAQLCSVSGQPRGARRARGGASNAACECPSGGGSSAAGGAAAETVNGASGLAAVLGGLAGAQERRRSSSSSGSNGSSSSNSSGGGSNSGGGGGGGVPAAPGLAAAHTSSQEAAAEPDEQPGCPMPWLEEYEAFHAANRGKPGTKYLMHTVTGIYSGGFGDRLRGMLYALRAAAAMKRVVLFQWSYPHALSNFFEPAGRIDWRPDGLQLPEAGLSLRGIDGPVTELESGALLNNTTPMIKLTTNRIMDSACAGCANITAWGADAACLWRRTLRPTADIQQRVQQHLQTMFGSASPRYVALHLRLGGLPGEVEFKEARGGSTPFHNMMKAVSCANRMAKHKGIDQPVMVVTDNHELRSFLREKNLVNVITPDLEPVHIDLAAKNSASDHKTSVVDLILLGRATCLVTSPSGFSHQAWLAGGGKPCQREFMNCTSLEAGASGGSGHLGK